MAKNWTAAEAVEVITKGFDKEAIQDIGKRFPLFAHNAAKGTEGLLTIISALSEKISARTIEAKLKEGVDESTDEEEVEETVEEKPKTGRGRKAATEDKPKTTGRGRKKPEPEVEEDEEEEEKPKRGRGKTAGKGKAKPEPEPEEEDEDLEDFDEDEEEVFDDEDEEDGLEELSLAELKALAKTNKVSIKGCKSSDDIIEKLRAKGITAPDADDDEEDEDDWDI